MDADQRARLKADIARTALPVLVERLGGLVMISEAEYEALWARYGGPDRVGVQARYADHQLTLTLVNTSLPGVIS